MNFEENKFLKRIRKATFEGNKNAISSAHNALAEYYFQEGRYEESIKEYKEAANIYQDLKIPLEYGRTNRMIGEAYSYLHCFDKALKHQTIHLNVAKQENDQLELQRAFATIGNTYLTRYLDDNEKQHLILAQNSFMKSLKICESITGIEIRERKDMLARLLANLGVVQECLGNIEKSLNLVEKSMSICKKYDLYEQLERGYSFLGSLYTRQEDYNKAVLHFNMAIEVAERLDNKVTLISTSLFAKAEIMIKIADFANAKNILLKAYKMKTPNIIERNSIERCLKVVATLNRAEETLIVTDDNDHKKRKLLFEKMGDCASELKIFPKAIEYYLKMLKESELCGDTGKALCPAYVSLAETYKDNKQYDLAIHYFQKEYAMYEVKDKDTQSTLFNIAECMELAKKDINSIEHIYNKARSEAKLHSEHSFLEGRAISRFIAFCRKHSITSKIGVLERELQSINYNHSESEGSEGEIGVTTNIGDDICIEDLTDNSDNSEEDDLEKPRRRTRGLTIKKNIKGETQLHTATITNNLMLVKKLIEQGHPVNIRDNAGWLPLHEACNLGYLEIVKVLLDNGANINDRGGIECDGVTPLHDAAYNGHLNVMELLLERKASSTVKTNSGETPLHILKKWKIDNEPLDSITQKTYNILVTRLTNDLEKAGHSSNIPIKCVKESSAFVREGCFNQNLPSTSKITRPSTRQRSPLRNIDNSSRSSTRLDYNSDEFEETSTSNYKEAIQNIRKRIPKQQTYVEYTKMSALLNSEEVVDDWLEDDLGLKRLPKKPRKDCEEFLNPAQRRSTVHKEDDNATIKDKRTLKRKESTNSIKSSSQEKSKEETGTNSFKECKTNEKQQFFSESIDIPVEFFDDNFDVEGNKSNDSVINIHSDYSSSTSFDGTWNSANKKRKRKSQISLIEAGFTRQVGNKSPGQKRDNFEMDKVILQQQKLLSKFGLNGSKSNNISPHKYNSSQISNYSNDTFNISSISSIQIQAYSIDVKIEKILLRIPIPSANFQELTMKWLKEQAAKRYFKKEFIEPILELQTLNGAELDEDDLLSTLFLPGSTRGEEICAKVVKWNLPPLLERYKESCANCNSEVNERIKSAIMLDDTNLNLSRIVLYIENFEPFFKSLKHHRSLLALNLSFTNMTDEGFLILCSTFPSLTNLELLDISSNGLSETGMKYFSDVFQESSQTILPQLVELNISFNPLENGAYKYLVTIAQFLNLKTLNLASCCFTDKLFDVYGNRGINLNLENVENFNIDFNALDEDSIVKFLSFLNPAKLVSLDIGSNCGVVCRGLIRKVAAIFEKCDNLNLKILNLERSHATDEEVFELLRVLQNAENFELINLAHNYDITAITLRRLFEHKPSLTKIYIPSVDILKGFDSCLLTDWIIEQDVEYRLKSVTISVNPEKDASKIKYLQYLWNTYYPNRSQVKIDKCFMKLSVGN